MPNVLNEQSPAGQMQFGSTAGVNMENGMLANGTGSNRLSNGADSAANTNAVRAMMGQSAAGDVVAPPGSSAGPAGSTLAGLNASFASIALDPSMVGSGGAAGIGAASVDAAGVDAAGVDAAGVDAAGVDAAGVGAAGVGRYTSSTEGGTPNEGALPNGYPPSEERIWSGNLHVCGHINDMVVPCVAVRTNIPQKPPVLDTSGWPQRLHCDSSKLRQCENMFGFMNEPWSQWYVRFVPVNDQVMEKEDPKLVELVKVMVRRKLAFEIECNKQSGAHGTLYLWGMRMPQHEHSLLGVFRPAHGMVVPEDQNGQHSGQGVKTSNVALVPHYGHWGL